MIDDLTVCITSFRRAPYLKRAIDSVLAAGISRIVVATSEPDGDVLAVLEEHKSRPGFVSVVFDDDIGCNRTWLEAAYRSRTDRMILLHDDDLLRPELGEAYAGLIKPAMDSGQAEFVSWRACLYFDDGTTRPTEWFGGRTRLMSSDQLRSFLMRPKRLSLSPIISVLRRNTLIASLKESERYLTPHQRCLYHPGMLLGTEIVAYLRHCEAHKKWMYVDQVLSMYGACDSSGTVKVQKGGDLSVITNGYDVAREHFRSGACKRIQLDPRIIFIYDDMPPRDEDEARRFDYAKWSWKFHFNHGTLLEFPVTVESFPRSSRDLGDERATPFVHDVLDYGCSLACPEDVVVFVNRDIGLTTTAPDRILSHTPRHGVSVGLRRNIIPKPGRYYRTVTNARRDGGVDMAAVTPAWWVKNKSKYPDMLIGREGWDWVFRKMSEEAAGRYVYLDDCLIHEPHPSWWKTVRKTNAGQQHNRGLAREFFKARKNHMAVRSLT